MSQKADQRLNMKKNKNPQCLFNNVLICNSNFFPLALLGIIYDYYLYLNFVLLKQCIKKIDSITLPEQYYEQHSRHLGMNTHIYICMSVRVNFSAHLCIHYIYIYILFD